MWAKSSETSSLYNSLFKLSDDYHLTAAKRFQRCAHSGAGAAQPCITYGAAISYSFFLTVAQNGSRFLCFFRPLWANLG
jgi:hypothetical protein